MDNSDVEFDPDWWKEPFEAAKRHNNLLGEGFLIDQDWLLRLLQNGQRWALSGIGGEGDPVVVAAVDLSKTQARDKWQGEPEALGAIALNGVTIVMFTDPCDGYRSQFGQVLVLPQEKLRNTFTAVEVRAQPQKKIGDDCYTDECDIVDLVSIHTGELLVRFGTLHSNDYYPSSHMEHHPAAITRATPFAQQREMERAVAAGRGFRTRL